MDDTLPRSLDWVNRLVRIDTTSRDSNRPAIDLIAEEAARLGLVPHVCPSPQGDKANLIVTVPAHDGSTAGGVVLSGHSDVVPVDGQDWHTDPFDPTVKDGKLYARGGCDMKGFIGVAVAFLPDMLAEPLSEPIHLTVSYDEEVGCIGGVQLMKDIANAGLAPRVCIVGEPSSMRVIPGHKSMNVMEATFTGKSCHSSLTAQGCNSVEYAARFITFLRAIAEEWRAEGPFDEAYDVPYSTLSTNLCHGGTAVNIVPEQAKVVWEFRTIGEVDVQATLDRMDAELARLEQQMQAEFPEASAVRQARAMSPGLDTDPSSPAVTLAGEMGGIVGNEKVPYGTEAGLFQQAGVETVVCGPGDIAQAHTPNEWIELDQLVRCEQFLTRLIESLRADSTVGP